MVRVARSVARVGAGGFAYEEAADICGCAVGTIKSRVARGRVALEALLSGGKLPGRDHWGAVQSVFFAGGGVKGGTVIGASDRIGGYPAADPQTPENMAATSYQALGLPRTAAWHDESDRPHHVYHGEPIAGLT